MGSAVTRACGRSRQTDCAPPIQVTVNAPEANSYSCQRQRCLNQRGDRYRRFLRVLERSPAAKQVEIAGQNVADLPRPLPHRQALGPLEYQRLFDLLRV